MELCFRHIGEICRGVSIVISVTNRNANKQKGGLAPLNLETVQILYLAYKRPNKEVA